MSSYPSSSPLRPNYSRRRESSTPQRSVVGASSNEPLIAKVAGDCRPDGARNARDMPDNSPRIAADLLCAVLARDHATRVSLIEGQPLEPILWATLALCSLLAEANAELLGASISEVLFDLGYAAYQR